MDTHQLPAKAKAFAALRSLYINNTSFEMKVKGVAVWRVFLFALISGDWNPIHFRAQVDQKGNRIPPILHGALVTTSMPRFAWPYLAPLREFAADHQLPVMDIRLGAEHIRPCYVGEQLHVKAVCKNVEEMKLGIDLTFEGEISVFRQGRWKVAQKGTQVLRVLVA